MPLPLDQVHAIDDGTGQVELARSEIREVVATLAPNDPERAACAAFATFLDAVCGPDRHATLVGRRAQVLAEALALRDAGDLRAAIARVDVAWVWRPREQTAMDVLAELWAALDPASEEERVRQRLVLAAQRAHDPERLAPLVLPGRPYRPPVLAPVIDDAPSDSR